MKKISYLEDEYQIKNYTEKGVFEGYASVFNIVDGGNDIVTKGAFQEILTRKPLEYIPLLLGHDMHQVVGHWEKIEEDDYGLWVRGRLALETQKGREVYHLLKTGAMTGLSIGYHVLKKNMDGQGHRVLRQIDLLEVSLVALPMNAQARLRGVKGASLDQREEGGEEEYLGDIFKKIGDIFLCK